MKKYVSFLMLASLMLFFSCSKEDGPTRDPNGRRLVSRIDYEYSDYALRDMSPSYSYNYNNLDYYVGFSYDGEGVLASASWVRNANVSYYEEVGEVETVTNCDIVVAANNLDLRIEVVRNENGESSSSRYLRRYTLNEAGFIATASDGNDEYEYSYSEAGELLSCRGGSTTVSCDWVGGNLVSSTVGRSAVYEYAYSYRENLCNMDMGAFSPVIMGETVTGNSSLSVISGYEGLLAMFGFFGVLNRNVLDESTTRCVYEFTSDGLIKKIEKYITRSDEQVLYCTLTFSYK